MRGQFVTGGGTEHCFEATGSGPAIAFLHAGIADHRMWEPQRARFAGSCRCLTCDIMGFGRTAFGESEFSLRDDLRTVMMAASCAPAVLVGCSIGAGIALDFALERLGHRPGGGARWV